MKTDANPILKDFFDRPKIYEIPFFGNIRAAGDSFIGGFCASLCEGKHIDDAVYYASAVSSMTIGKAGASIFIPTAEEVKQFIKNNEMLECGND